ncbi:MAG: Nif3-like dinuclear metal center hexameric protein [Bacteroidales bacterium]|nr:Nif3-like dinuclear metal center hexameric protein [Bacteroidales bacterium]
MTAREVAAMIEAWAPLSIQESWDNAGFCVGLPQAPVRGVLLCLDVTPKVIEEALELGADMIISHHPLIFHGFRQLCGQNEVARMVALAIKSDLVIYSSHTNADKVASGVSGVMAEMLALQNIEILHPDKQSVLEGPVGLGVVGNLPSPQEVHSFLQMVKRIFHLSCLRVGAEFVPVINRVAVCGGSGSSIIPQALESGADIFLSGDIGYHHFFSLEKKMMIADIGHYESEIGIVQKFARMLSEKNVNFAVHITKNNTNPIQYL